MTENEDFFYIYIHIPNKELELEPKPLVITWTLFVNVDYLRDYIIQWEITCNLFIHTTGMKTEVTRKMEVLQLFFSYLQVCVLVIKQVWWVLSMVETSAKQKQI